jgi:hypothetical protein
MKKKKIIFSDIDKLTKKIKRITLDVNGNFTVDLNQQLSTLFNRNINIDEALSVEFKKMITEEEIRLIILDNLKRTKSGKYALPEKDLNKFMNLFRVRLASNIVVYLVKNNYVEQAYDEEENNFCFF